MPYSVSIPITRRTLMLESLVPYSARARRRALRGLPAGRYLPRHPARLQVLPGVGHRVDGAAGLRAALAGDQRPDVDDALALLAGYPCPVIRVGGIRQVLVLPEFVHASGQQVRDPQAFLAGLQEFLDGHLLRAVHDVLDHGTGVEVLEIQDFLVPVGVGDLEELVLLGL